MIHTVHDDGVTAADTVATGGPEHRWAVVFVLAQRPAPGFEELYLQRLPLRAAFVDTPSDPLLIVRSTGEAIEALADAVTAIRTVHLEDESPLAFRKVDMISHEDACRELDGGKTVSYVSMTEAAEKLGVTRQRASQLMKDSKLPPPDATVGARPLWEETTFDRFASCRRDALEETTLGHSPNLAEWWRSERAETWDQVKALGWFEDSSME